MFVYVFSMHIVSTIFIEILTTAAGELLNTTLGNATKVVFAILQLKYGMIHAVQLSLLGSILSNLLSSLGCSFFIEAILHNKNVQVFNPVTLLYDEISLFYYIIPPTFCHLD